jgi:hypothetical protein
MTVSLEQALTGTLAELLFQLEMADDSQINSDFAVALMESVGASLQQIEGLELARFTAIIREMAGADFSDSQRQYLSDFLDNFGLSGGLA